MNPYQSVPDPPEVRTTELDWPAQAQADGWFIAQGQCTRENKDEPFDEGERVYLGDGVWEDAAIAALPAGEPLEPPARYADALAATADAVRQEQSNNQEPI